MSQIILACYPNGFKIRSHADVKKAIGFMTKGMEHVIKVNEACAVFIDIKVDGSYIVSIKTGNLYDLFNPQIQAVDTVRIIYSIRALINKKYFS